MALQVRLRRSLQACTDLPAAGGESGLSSRASPHAASSPVPCAPCSLGSALGTIAYSAPETFADNQVKKPSDVYAFGIMREWGRAWHHGAVS